MPMEPLPETVEAVAELSVFDDQDDLLAGLVGLAERARTFVPELVGVSLSRLTEQLTFTVVSTSMEVGAMDAVQYVDGGPCADSAQTDEVVTFDATEVLDERRWRLFAEATAARGVRSTLTLPLRLEEGQTGTVNLYAASPGAFVGHHEDLAAVFGAWAHAAVSNADLAFETMQAARAAPGRVRDLVVVNTAVGLLAARLDVSIEVAETRLWDAAARAAVPPVELARLVIDCSVSEDSDDARGSERRDA